MEKHPQSRRTFITTLTLLVLSGGLVRYLMPVNPARRQVLASASVTDVPVNGALVFRDERIALLHDEAGLYALSLVCTHLGCTVTLAGGKLQCPCHGSLFDRRGSVIKGPADRPLDRLELVEINGRVTVYSS